MRSALILAVLAVAVPAAQHNDPITAARFEITIDGHSFAVFTELEGISSSVDVVDSISRDSRVKRFRVDGVVTLRRPMTANLEIAKWHEEAIARGPASARDMALVLYGADGAPVARWNFTNAWPAKYAGATSTSGESAVMMESVTLVCERIQRVSP